MESDRDRYYALTPEERELVDKYGFEVQSRIIFTRKDDLYGSIFVFRSPASGDYMAYILTTMLKCSPSVTGCSSPVEAYKKVMETLAILCEKEKNEGGT